MSSEHVQFDTISTSGDFGLQRYLSAVRESGMYPNSANLLRYVQYIYRGVTLKGARVLDIGGGCGLFSFYAGCMGAKEVVCLEPEIDGSRGPMAGQFESIAKRLDSLPVRLMPRTLQELDLAHGRFDVQLLHNSINHLDEPSCVALHRSPEAQANYVLIFRKLRDLAARGAALVVADCSRHNFFGSLGLRNPVARSIEWHKHQPPELWIRLLERTGYRDPKLSWSTFNSLGRLGRIVLGNRPAAFFLNSHFRFVMHAAGTDDSGN